MTYTEAQIAAANAAIDKYRSEEEGEVGPALAVVGPSVPNGVAREAAVRERHDPHRASSGCIAAPARRGFGDSTARP